MLSDMSGLWANALCTIMLIVQMHGKLQQGTEQMRPAGCKLTPDT